MIKLNIKKSKQFEEEYNTSDKIIYDNTIYNYSNKKLKFTGADILLRKIIKLLNPINIEYTESYPSVYNNGDDITKPYYYTIPGIIYITVNHKYNRKTKYNIKKVSEKLNSVYGYSIQIKYENKYYWI